MSTLRAEDSAEFWRKLEGLVASSRIVIDRPKGSHHPRYPELVYPFDYGYLEGTTSGDGAGIDVWAGSLPERGITALVCTVDALKRDAEMKILLGCTPEEAHAIRAFHEGDCQSALLIFPSDGGEDRER